MPESFITTFHTSFFDNKITFVDSKGDFVLKNRFEMLIIRFLIYKNNSNSDLV